MPVVIPLRNRTGRTRRLLLSGALALGVLLLLYFGRLSVETAAIVAIGAIGLGLLYVFVMYPSPDRFRLTIRPDWGHILTDYALASPERTRLFFDALGRTKSEQSYSLLAHGITFTVLAVDLAYRDDRHYSFANTAIVEPIPELEDPPGSGLRDATATVYVTLELDGYHLGVALGLYHLGVTSGKIDLPDERRCSECEFDLGQKKIHLATLPYLALERRTV